MKIRSLDELSEFLDGEYAWRRKELTSINSDVKAAHGDSRDPRIRGAIALLYAHWEGFVKNASHAYLTYVSSQRLHYCQLSTSFLALSLRKQLQEFSDTNDPVVHNSFVELMTTGLSSEARVPRTGAIDTKSNLNSKRMKRIVLTLGLDYSPYELKENLIDEQLLNWRNNIAHGKGNCPNESDFELLYVEVGNMLRAFKDQVSNAASQSGFRKHG